jgi:hypothetical protein
LDGELDRWLLLALLADLFLHQIHLFSHLLAMGRQVLDLVLQLDDLVLLLLGALVSWRSLFLFRLFLLLLRLLALLATRNTTVFSFGFL